MHNNMAKAQKNRASKNPYISPSQLSLVGFESPFSQMLDPNNRWGVLAHKIPCHLLVGTYIAQMNNSSTGAEGINPRATIGEMNSEPILSSFLFLVSATHVSG
jgi:hypothetical protein